LRVTCEIKVDGFRWEEENRIYWYTAADSSGMTRLTLWEEEVGKMEEGRSYRLMAVREFRERKLLSTSKQNSTVEKVDDIGDVEEEDSNEERGTVNIIMMSGSRVKRVCLGQQKPRLT